MIKVEKLNKYYKQGLFKKLHVINNTTLEIPKSGIIAVVGKSGVGKTTLLNTISGLDNFKNGTISFNEEKTDHYDSKFADKLRMEHFGFVFQNYYLLKDRSVYDNVNLSLDSFKLTEDEKKERINYVLKQLGISKYTNKLVSNLSGGEQQRVSIARALVKSPKVIFADEPTGSLDEMTTFTVLNILKKVSKNCAVFIVTHEKELISYYADYIIELDHGVIVKEFVPENKTINGLAVDQNIYLDELKKESEYKDSNVELNLFSDSSVNKDIKINVAIKNSKIYLESSEEIIYLDKNSEAKMLKGERRKIQDYVDNDFNFELPPIEYNKNKNNFNTIFKKSFNNLRIKSSFKTLLRVVLVLLSVILVLLFESIKQLKNKDLSMVVSASQGNIYVSVSPNAYGVGSSMLSEAYQNLRIEIENLGDDKITTMFTSFEALNFSYEGFYQYKKKMYNLKVYDFKPISYLNQKDLIYGRMPEKRNEIVIDEYTLNRFMSNNYLSNIINSYEFFIGKEFVGQYSNERYVVSGISRTKNPTIYGSEFLNFVACPSFARVNAIDYDSFIKEYPEYSNITLGEKETIRRSGTSKLLEGFSIIDEFDFSIPYDYVIRKEDLSYLKEIISFYKSEFYIVTDGSEKAINKCLDTVTKFENTYYNELIKDTVVVIFANHNYELQFNEETAKLQSLTNVAIIVSVVISALSIVLIVFTTNRTMIRQIGEIAIYRSLGYSKGYMFMIYFMELTMNTLIHVIIGSFVTYLVMGLLSIIPLVPYTITINPFEVLLVVLGASLIIITIGVLSIISIINKTPTQIYNTYNRKIEGQQ